MENKHKHLEMIQGVINRMASNSFALKGWTVTLVAGLFALSSKGTNKVYFAVVYVPVLVFLFLDSYYLWQERLFRALYGKVRKMENDQIDYSMNNNLPEFKSWNNSFWGSFFSKTEIGFYLPLAGLVAIVTCVICAA